MRVPILGLLYEPVVEFRRLLAKPQWLLPMAISAGAQLLSVMWILGRVGVQDFVSIAAQQAGVSHVTAPNPEQAGVIRWMIYLAAVGSVPLYVLAASLVLLLFLWVCGYTTRLTTLISICSHANCITWVASSIVSVCVIALVADYSLVDMQNLGSVAPTTFIGPNSCSKWMYGILSSVDAIGVWYAGLLACGLKAAEPKMPVRASVGFVLSAWLIFAGARAVLTSL